MFIGICHKMDEVNQLKAQTIELIEETSKTFDIDSTSLNELNYMKMNVNEACFINTPLPLPPKQVAVLCKQKSQQQQHHHHNHQHNVAKHPQHHQQLHHYRHFLHQPHHRLSYLQLHQFNVIEEEHVAVLEPNKQQKQQLNKISVHSIGSESISATIKGKCCNEAARNPAIKTGRRIQLLQVTIATDLGIVVTRYQVERSDMAFFIFTHDSNERSNLTDAVLNNMERWNEICVPMLEDEDEGEVMLNRFDFQHCWKLFGDTVRSESSITDVINGYMSKNSELLHHMSEEIKETNNNDVWCYLVDFKNLLKSIECQNIAISFAIKYYGLGQSGSDAFLSYVQYEFLTHELMHSTLGYVPQLLDMYINISSTKKYNKMKSMNWAILKNLTNVSDQRSAIEYFNAMHNFTDDLRILQTVLFVVLFQMPPPRLAIQLKHTQQVAADIYATITVFFNDIVSFTKIAALMRMGGFIAEYRGLIDIQRNGLMGTYWLTGKDGEEISWFADKEHTFLENLKFYTALQEQKELSGQLQ